MPDGQVKAIELQGIVRNRTKIGVQDGQAEDLLNLRYVNGAWRTSGNGRQIEFQMGAGGILTYSQLYVHTNIYRHLLGVHTNTTTNVSTLYWFASIDTDGVTFYPLDNTTSRTSWPADMQDLPTAPVALTTVHGDLWITQNGHLITIIDEADDFEYCIFKTGMNKYINIGVDANGKPDSRKLYPFGYIHFNLLSGDTDDYMYSETDGEQYVVVDKDDINYNDSPACIPKSNESTTHAAAQIWHAQMLQVFHKATEDNRFTSPFLIVAAIKLYDGSYAFATQPILLNPRENMSETFSGYGNMRNAQYINHRRTIEFIDDPTFGTKSTAYDTSDYGAHAGIHYDRTQEEYVCERLAQSTDDPYPVYTSGCSAGRLFGVLNSYGPGHTNNMQSVVLGSDIAISIEYLSQIIENRDIFSGLSIFITPQSFLFDMSEEGYKEGEVFCSSKRENYTSGRAGHTVLGNASYYPKRRTKSEVIYDLFHSPFYLLREYSIDELVTLKNTIRVDLTRQEDKNVLLNITAQKRLDYEANARTTYIPKVSHMYNGRLHIANYKAYPFYGYPIDLFHLHNHSVEYEEGSWFPADEDGKRVLPNLTPYYDDYIQHSRGIYQFYETGAYGGGVGPYAGLCNNRNLVYAYIKVTIDTDKGEQTVVRYIKPYDTNPAVNGRADFIEKLNPLLTYPDARAKKMCVFVMCATPDNGGYVRCYYDEFDLLPHPYLNIAYHISQDLTPIPLYQESVSMSNFIDPDFNDYADTDHPKKPTKIPAMENIEEHFPNGLKVSKTDNPLFFPVNNTHQVGSSEIVALCNNAIAVGTGQTGDAPLYVFCKDGIYALYVDEKGEMAYTNARIIARDVVNNPRSVTPTDQGVVFTTDRGLMMIAGEQVNEIGEPAEGDVKHYWDNTKVDFVKAAAGAMQFVAGLPTNDLCDGTDFLTYLTGAIVNYNHNERELMISNPNKSYSYILDREGNWSRRYYTAEQYINNYPTSYRLTSDGVFYKVDEETGTSLEERKEASNQFFYLSNVLKLNSIGFKKAQRFVARGFFETPETLPIISRQKSGNDTLSNIPRIDTMYNASLGINELTNGRTPNDMRGRKLRISCKNNGSNTIQFGIGLKQGSTGETYLADLYLGGSTAEERNIAAGQTKTGNIEIPTSGNSITGMYVFLYSGSSAVIGEYDVEYTIEEVLVDPYIGCYVFGSYDGRKWAMLGGNEKTGSFTDIGCTIERTDVRFLRICLAGKMTGKSRIDYMEISSMTSVMNAKIR